MREKSLDAILESLDFKKSEDDNDWKERRPLTIWLSTSDKARYDRLQKMTNRQFGKTARVLLLAAIGMAEARAT
jgi:hypothetical protein